MKNRRRVVRLKFDTEAVSVTYLVTGEVSQSVFNSIGKKRVMRFKDIGGDWHAVIMANVFHVEAGASPSTMACEKRFL